MFPLGCLEWIILSNCLSSADIQYAHTARHACKQAVTLIRTHIRHMHIRLSHVPPTASHMVGYSFPGSPLCSLLFVSLPHTRQTRGTSFYLIKCHYIFTIDIVLCIDIAPFEGVQ